LHFPLSPGWLQTSLLIAWLTSVAQSSGKPVGMVCGSPEEGRTLVERGFRLLSYSIDVILYEDAVRAGLDEVRRLLA